jgi:hypothetical protein
MNDVTQRAGVISSGMLVFFYKIFFLGIFLEIHHDYIQCRFNVIFAQLGF